MIKNIYIFWFLMALVVEKGFAADSQALTTPSEDLAECYAILQAARSHIRKGNEDSSNGEGKGSSKYEMHCESYREEARGMTGEDLIAAINKLNSLKIN